MKELHLELEYSYEEPSKNEDVEKKESLKETDEDFYVDFYV